MEKKEMSISDGLKNLPIRPVYLLSVEHEEKRSIITIGMFAVFSGRPPIVGVGIAPSRYSFDLIQKSREYVVNAVDENLMKAVNVCGEKSGRDTDKFVLAELTPVKGLKVKAPLIKESPVSLECRVINEVEAGDHVWFLAEVLATHVREGYKWQDGLLFKWVEDDGLFFKPGQRVGEY